jgi:SAM-dependent methyltransferase
MGSYIDLLKSLPKTPRDVAGRHADKSPEVVAIAKQYGRDYFDGDRKYGYGGYYHDGRWASVAHDILGNYLVTESPRILDVGCAKGYLVAALQRAGSVPTNDVQAFGIDISRYAVVECPHPDAVGRLHLGTADDLPFPDNSFDLVLSINTLHNLPRPRLIRALQEMRRVSRGSMFVQVDAYRTEAEKALFLDWVLTAEWTGYPEEWLALFAEAGYDGDYAWTVVEAG